ncbi:sugar transferase [Erythrobacter sp. KMU-140]|uniref:Sugar transferase n=2 Tax=Erythrobacter rubeus TaxID=2760803 RepID=A0ABR8KMU1_9SPHN|nr:sugar transferase [Erythrobacter rubeus]
MKRALDIVVAALMLVLLAPVMLLVAIAVKVSSPGPVLFRQERVGSQGRHFKCLKFRTMHVDAEIKLAQLLRAQPDLRLEWQCKQKLSADPRITNIGNFLRQSSLDELPQLFNVLRGDMSLVGPRPIIRAEVPRYGRYITSYFKVKPGLSGLWQISGRNDASYARRVAADVLYARSRTFAMDLRILLMTVPAVISGKGSC